MKKIILYTLLAGAAILALPSCIEDSRENYMVDDSISLVYDDPVIPVSVYSGSCTISIQKAGKGKTAAAVTVALGADSLAEWNADEGNDQKYEQIDPGLVSFSSEKVEFSADEVRKTLTVNWDPAKMIAALHAENQVIPVTLNWSDISINPDRALVLVNVLNSTAAFASSGSTVTAKENASEKGEVSVKFKLDHALPTDISLSYSIDNSLIADYNAAKGTSYTQAPDGLIAAGEAVIPAGKTDVFATIPVNTEKLFNGGTMMDFRTHVVPLRLTKTSIDGVILGEGVYYLLVNSPYAGATFSLIWGLYSTESNWAAAYGLPSGADRNLALDANWVYLPCAVAPSAGGKAEITAISVSDPETTKMVNCSGMEEATLTSACVRTIDKGNGTLMLVATGAAENDFPFYAWTDGIDNPPTRTSLQCTWRRGGDRFEYHGTWADGELYVHSYQGHFATRYKIENGSFVKTEEGTFNGTDRALVNMLTTDTGFGGFYKYPGQDQMVFTTSDVSAFITMMDSYVNPGDGQKAWETAREEFPGADLTWGYRCFTYRGEKYIAYTSVDKDDDVKEDGVTPYTTLQRARLVVVKDKGGYKASLLGDEKDIVFEAPIQGPEFTSFAIAPPISKQGDCAVCVLGDKVLIAAGVQGLGLVLYKME